VKHLIVNADDFGQSPGINRGVIEAHEHGIVTSASLMVRWPAAADAAAWARMHPALGVGLHVDLGEWRPHGSDWIAAYHVVDGADSDAVALEVNAQLEAFRSLVGRDPTHLDSHQHVHRDEPAGSVLRRLARSLGVPLRHFSPRVRYCGDFYGQDEKGAPLPEYITVDHLLEIIASVPDGITELACHPAADADLDSQYLSERLLETRALCDPRVKNATRSLMLRSFQPDDGVVAEPEARR
jgi:predicted glycoside hydrolase/deacetylase ChbG (UPF0249 family)